MWIFPGAFPTTPGGGGTYWGLCKIVRVLIMNL